MINEQVKEKKKKKKKTGQRKLGAYQYSCSWRRKLVFLHKCKFPLRDVTVYTRMCAHRSPCQYAVITSCWNSPSQVMEVRYWMHECLRERYIDSGQQKHWSQGIDPRYIIEQTRSKLNHIGAPRMPGRKERQGERSWGVCRGKATTSAVYEK